MSKPWKAHERRAAKLLGGKRYWANSGAAVDVESAGYVVQCKHVQSCSLAQLERLAIEVTRQGDQKTKIGLVYIKRRAGHGMETPALVVMTEAMFRAMSGPVPLDGVTSKRDDGDER